MYCYKCGKSIDDEAVVCPHCGVPTVNAQSGAGTGQNLYQPPQLMYGENSLAILGFVLSWFFIFSVPALVFSIIGTFTAPKRNGKGLGLSLSGIVISSLQIVFFVLFILVFIPLFEEWQWEMIGK